VNTPDNTWGLPREVIPWGPTIDGGRCRGSGDCVKFCPNSVYEFDAAEGRARVAHFHHCMVLCSNCVDVCPNGAISFPSQDEFLDRVQELRRQLGNPPLQHPSMPSWMVTHDHRSLDVFDTTYEMEDGRLKTQQNPNERTPDETNR